MITITKSGLPNQVCADIRDEMREADLGTGDNRAERRIKSQIDVIIERSIYLLATNDEDNITVTVNFVPGSVFNIGLS